MGIRSLVALVAATVLLLPPTTAAGGSANDGTSDVELVGAFLAGGPITGAALLDGYLYVATPDRLSIYDASQPLAPRLVGTQPSPHNIYGELISTDGKTLLLNDGLAGGTLDVWNVEDKTNPLIVSTVRGVTDEHVSCLLGCSWAYGSDGTIIDLRHPGDPDKLHENWKEIAGFAKPHLHRVDEFRTGFMATGPRQGPPMVVDVRRPLKPRVIASTGVPKNTPSAFLFSTWARGGRDRYLVTSTEQRRCTSEREGALVTFDSQGWPKDRHFELAGSFRYQGRTEQSDNSCAAYYFSLHPDFDDGGLILLPNGLEGTRIVEVSGRGAIEEVDSFVPPLSDVWLSFWIDEEIFYALNTTGEVYILRYG